MYTISMKEYRKQRNARAAHRLYHSAVDFFNLFKMTSDGAVSILAVTGLSVVTGTLV